MKLSLSIFQSATAVGMLLCGGVTTIMAQQQGEIMEFKLQEATIADIHAAVDAGALTYTKLTSMYLARIAEYDEEYTNAIMKLNPTAMSQAVQADEEFSAGQARRGPLHGIPVLLKDLIDVKGMATTGGSIVLQDCFAATDAPLVTTLREGGAVVLGKTSLSEFAASYGRLGFSSAGGTVLNPYNPLRSASGSSSGSAAAVAANFAVMALGSDTAGSIRSPASATALVGMKPTKGLVSTDGVLPYSHWTDVLGPLTRTVMDAALSLAVLEDSSKDNTVVMESTEMQTEWELPTTWKGALDGVTLGRIVGFSGGNAEVDALFEAAVADLESLGATVVTLDLSTLVTEVEILDGYINAWSVLGGILGYECQDPLNEYFAKAAASSDGCPANLAEVVNDSFPYNDTLNAMNPSRLAAMASCVADAPSVTDPEFVRLTTQVVPLMDETLKQVMTDNNVSAWIFPTMLCPSQPTWNVGDPTWECDPSVDQWSTGYMANTMGWPEVSVPMGYTSEATGGAPAGLSILSSKYMDAVILGYAYDYEQATMHRKAPPGFAALEGEEFTYSTKEPEAPTDSGVANKNNVFALLVATFGAVMWVIV